MSENQKQNGQQKLGDASEKDLLAAGTKRTPVANDPDYEIARVGFTRELDLGNGITDAIQQGNIYDVRKVGSTFEVRQKNRDGVYEIYPAQVSNVLWKLKVKPAETTKA